MMQAELYKEYQTRVIPALSKSLGYKNVFQVPKVHKVVVNTCIPAQSADLKQALEDAKKELAVHYRSETGGDEIEKKHLQFQASEGAGDRGKGDLARRSDVRISGAPH